MGRELSGLRARGELLLVSIQRHPRLSQRSTYQATPGGDISTGDGAAWVAEAIDGVYRIDPATNTATQAGTVESNGQRLSVAEAEPVVGGVIVTGFWADPTTDQAGRPDFTVTDDVGVAEITLDGARSESVQRLPSGTGGIGYEPTVGGIYVSVARQVYRVSWSSPTLSVTRVASLRDGEQLLAVSPGVLWIGSQQVIRKVPLG